MLIPEDGRQESVITQTEISNPVNHTLYICIERQRTCQLERFWPGSAASSGRNSSGKQGAGGPEKTSLGKQSIAGVEAD
ncbi:hypothetical protein ACX0FC_19535, partial [Enterococcus faecium]